MHAPARPFDCDFVALDFETADSTRGSACAVGVAMVARGEVTGRWVSLIDPEVPFGAYNVKVHGIDERSVRGAPTFRDLWPTLTALLDGATVVAHNASFDISVLRSSAARCGVSGGPTFEVFCSYRLARLLWKEHPSHSLGYLGPALGIDFAHHDPGDDAVACARITQALCKSRGLDSLRELATDLGLVPGQLTPDSFAPLSLAGDVNRRGRSGREDADPNHPLFGKSICFTGALASMSRREAMERVTLVGCDFKTSVSKSLDYLVLGDADFMRFSGGLETTKLRRVTKLRQDGVDIEVIPERVFLEFLLS